MKHVKPKSENALICFAYLAVAVSYGIYSPAREGGDRHGDTISISLHSNVNNKQSDGFNLPPFALPPDAVTNSTKRCDSSQLSEANCQVGVVQTSKRAQLSMLALCRRCYPNLPSAFAVRLI
jgi:hypothetical protein